MTRTNLVAPGPDGTLASPAGGTPPSSNALLYNSNVPSITQVVIAQPAAGTEWAYVVPTGTWFRLTSGYTIFTTSAAVANRALGLIIKDSLGTPILRNLQQGAAWTASLSGHLAYCRADKPLQAGNLVPGTTESQIGIPPLVLQPGWTIGSVTSLMDAGDQYSGVRILAELWTSQPVHDVPGPML